MAWGGYRNGYIPAQQALVFIEGGWARPDFAKAVLGAIALILATFGIRITFNEFYRDINGQIYWREWWTDAGKPNNAAVPGYSNHGWAVAFDMDYHSWNDHYVEIVGIFAAFGIIFDVDGEDWHGHFTADWDGSTPESFQLASLNTRPILIPEGDDMPLVYANTETNVWAIGSTGRWDGIPGGQGDAFVKFSGHDLIKVDNATWEAARAYWLGGRILDYSVIADVSNNVWYVMGPGVVYPIPGGQGDLWQSLYGPRKAYDHGTVQTMIDGYSKMAPRTDWDGITKAIAALAGPQHAA